MLSTAFWVSKRTHPGHGRTESSEKRLWAVFRHELLRTIDEAFVGALIEAGKRRKGLADEIYAPEALPADAT